MKNILFISNHAGFSKFNQPYIDLLASKGIKVYNASPGIEISANCIQIDVPIKRNPLGISNFVTLYSLIKKIKDENILYVHCHTPSGGLIGRLLKLFIPSLKVIYTAHGFHFYKGAPVINWIIYFVIEWLLAPLTQAIITINEEDYQLSKKHLKGNSYKINGVGINLDRFTPNEIVRESGRQEMKINENSIVFIYAAQFIDRKNHELLINTFSKYHNTNSKSILLLLGNGPLEVKQKQLVDHLNMTENIRFLGYQKNIEYYYQLSDIAISVSKQEGLPMNLVESLATGLTILASDIRGHRDIIHQSPGNYLFQLNEKSLLDSLLSIDISTVGDVNLINQNINSAKKFALHSSLSQMKEIYSTEFNLNLSI